MRVTFVGESRLAARTADAASAGTAGADPGLVGGCATAGVATPPASAAPTTPLSDFAKPLRSSAICLRCALRQRVRQDLCAFVAAARDPDDLLPSDQVRPRRAGLLVRHLDRTRVLSRAFVVGAQQCDPF